MDNGGFNAIMVFATKGVKSLSVWLFELLKLSLALKLMMGIGRVYRLVHLALDHRQFEKRKKYFIKNV